MVYLTNRIRITQSEVFRSLVKVYNQNASDDQVLWLRCNLRSFMVMHRIEAVNSMSNFFSKNNPIQQFFFNWIELNRKPIKLSPCRFILFKIDSMVPLLLNYPRVIIRAIVIIFQWFYLGRLHRLRLLYYAG